MRLVLVPLLLLLGLAGANVLIPGPPGPEGPIGPPGHRGATGPAGHGTTGAQGKQGAQGLRGTTGAQGAHGLTGAQGSQGAQGQHGATGAQGPAGSKGATGAQGPRGATGLGGLPGIPGLHGATGAQGAQGPVGFKGATGAQGAQGLHGATGAQGSRGLTGMLNDTMFLLQANASWSSGLCRSCSPRTCSSLGYNCGVNADGCGGTVNCSSCAQGMACGIDTFSQCGSTTFTSCTPFTCSDVGYNCGNPGNGCGGVLHCGTCPSGQTCGANGMPNQCSTGSPCTPGTCAALGYSCGLQDDGCGNTINCGTCTAPDTCGGGGGGPAQAWNRCDHFIKSPCSPKTCLQLGATCGTVGDGCGGVLHCGTCTAPNSCGGGGVANVCGHFPACPNPATLFNHTFALVGSKLLLLDFVVTASTTARLHNMTLSTYNTYKLSTALDHAALALAQISRASAVFVPPAAGSAFQSAASMTWAVQGGGSVCRVLVTAEGVADSDLFHSVGLAHLRVVLA